MAGPCQLLLLLAAVSLAAVVPLATAAAAGACTVQYRGPAAAQQTAGNSTASLPLLLGGQVAGCIEGCQPRDDVWSRECRLQPDEYLTWGACEEWQQAANREIAAELFGGALTTFSPCELHSYLAGRTLWIIGDSHMKNFYPAIRCFMLDFWDHSLGECAASSNQTLQELLQQTALFPPRQKNIKATVSPRCVHLLQGGRICMVQSVRGEQLVSDDPQKPGVLQLLQAKFALPQDIFYIGVGRWYYLSCSYDPKAFANSLERLGQFYQSTHAEWPNLMFSVAPHDHSCSAGKDWNSTMDHCAPISRPAGNSNVLLIGEQVQRAAHEILSRYNVPVVDSYNISKGMHDSHISVKQSYGGTIDCLHMCRPGLPEMDIYFMFDVLRTRVARVTERQLAQQQAVQQSYGCGAVAADFPRPWYRQTVQQQPAGV